MENVCLSIHEEIKEMKEFIQSKSIETDERLHNLEEKSTAQISQVQTLQKEWPKRIIIIHAMEENEKSRYEQEARVISTE